MLDSPDATTPPIPSRRSAPHDPRALDAVYRALFVLETSARQLTVDVWRGGRVLTGSDIPGVIRRPNFDTPSLGVFVAETVSSLAQRGNAYWRIYRDPKKQPAAIVVLNPLRVNVSKSGDLARPHYYYDGDELDHRDIVHLRLTHTPGEPLGLGPIQACMSSLESALELREYANNWTSTRNAPTGIVTTDQSISREQAEIVKKDVNEKLQFKNGIAVLGNGLKFERLLLNPAELQFLDSINANTSMVARIFGIPARTMLAAIDGSSETYSNLEQANQDFIRFTLMAYLSEIEDALTEVVPLGQTVKFNVDGFLRADIATRYAAHSTGIASGFLTTAEAREIEGLPPLNESDNA